jgi:hypothetical protein
MWSGNRSVRSRRSARRLAWLAALGLLLASACSGRSTVVAGADDDQAGPPSSGTGGKGGSGGHAGAGVAGMAAGRGGSAGTGGTGDVPYNDPGCPDAAAPSPVVECNVFDAVSACGTGLACKPDIEHPFGSGCDQQVINMRCVPAGSGLQGDPCDGGMATCGDGFLCVIGASHGPRCLRMCPLDGSTPCPSGYICGPTDADGIGVCA